MHSIRERERWHRLIDVVLRCFPLSVFSSTFSRHDVLNTLVFSTPVLPQLWSSLRASPVGVFV